MAQVSYVFNSHVEPAFLNLEEHHQTSRTSRVRVQQRRIVAAIKRDISRPEWVFSGRHEGIGSNPK
jgi:hypothetical protein